MKNFMYQTLKRGICSIPFLISCLLVIIAMSSALYLDRKFDNIDIFQRNAVEIFIRGYYYSNSILPSIASIICTIPFSVCYVMDQQSGFEKNLIMRMGRKKYFQSRFCTTGIMGAFSFLLPMIIYFFVVFLLFRTPISENSMEEFVRHSPYGFVNSISPYFYVITIIIHCSIFGAVYAVLGFAVSFFVKKKYVAWLFPFLLTIVFSLFSMYLNVTAIEPMSVFAVTRNINVSFITIFGEFIILFVGSYFIANKKLEKDMENDKEF